MRGLKIVLGRIINSILAPLHLEVRSVYSGGRMFPESFVYLKKVLPPPAEKTTVIDVGVAGGTPELWAAFPASEYQYLLIEANPFYAEKLKKTASKMGAILETVFCGDHDGTETFITDDLYDPGKASKYSRKTGGNEKRSEVPSFTLDTIIKKHSLAGPFILKVDVEGAELDVLRGASETLMRTEAIIVETPISLKKDRASSFGAIVSYLHERGFAVVDFAETTYDQKSGFLNFTNTIFLREVPLAEM